jgi:uncharacterized peroxidase-related enzyme
MSYIQPIELSATSGDVRSSLEDVQRALGVLPNMFRTLAHSPVALQAYTQLSSVSAKGTLNARQREQIALAVGQTNGCDYCVAAHSVIGGMTGLSTAAIQNARRLQAEQPKDSALLKLAASIVEHRGHVPIADLDAFKAAGHDDGLILEVLVNVVLNIYTNYTNHIARTTVDFPLPAAH